MENKIFEPVCAKQTRPNYSVGSDQDDQKSSLTDWVHKNGAHVKNVKRSQLPTSLECVCCHEIPAVKAFHLKFKARLSWNTAVLEFFAVEFNCVGNHFLEEFFSEISQESFLSLTFNVFKMTPFHVFRSYFVFIVMR